MGQKTSRAAFREFFQSLTVKSEIQCAAANDNIYILYKKEKEQNIYNRGDFRLRFACFV